MRLGRLKAKLHFGSSKPKPNPVASNEADVAGPSQGQLSEPSTSHAAKDTRLNEPKSGVSTGDSINKVPICELWNVAYEKLKEEDGELVQHYEEALHGDLAFALGPTLVVGVSRREQMKVILTHKMAEVKRDTWKLKFGGSEVPVRDLAEPVLGIIDRANDYITDAVSGNAYASIAWAGVSLLLPLLLNPSQQAASLAKGLQYIASLIVQSRMWEDLYVRRYEAKTSGHESSPVSHTEYRSALEVLYRSILTYQITAYCYYAKSSTSRLGLDMVKWDDWAGLLDDVREQERVFAALSTVWRDMKYDEECEAAEKRHRQSLGRWDALNLDVQGLRKAVENAQADGKRRAFLHWLSEVDPSVTYNMAREKHERGTGEWLLRDNEKFRAWQESPGSLLWLHGKAGSGKSVLSSSVIKYLRDRLSDAPETALAYFYFSFNDSKKQNVVEMLCSLVKQLCSRRPDTPRPIEGLMQYQIRGERPDIETLEAALIATMRGFSAVHIVIDGLDECPTLTGDRKKLLDSLHRIVTSTPQTIHILCASRKEADIDAVISLLLSPPARDSIDLEAYRSQLDRDVGLYIDSVLSSSDFDSWPADVKREVRDQLIEKAAGMFQYVSCQFDELRNLSSEAAIRTALKSLPAGLDATYDRMLLSIDASFQQQVVSTLEWLCFSDRPLTLQEVAEIFVLHPLEPVILDITDRLFRDRDVLRYLGCFVVLSRYERYDVSQGSSGDNPDGGGKGSQLLRTWADQKRAVTLAHFSIKEYLTSTRISRGPAAVYSLSEEVARLHIAYTCLRYLSEVLLPEGPTKSAPGSHLLMDHALLAWRGHLETVPRETWPAGVIQAARRALAPRSRTLFNLASFTHVLHDANGGLMQPCVLTSQLGLAQITAMLLSTDEYLTQLDLDASLQQAAHGGNQDLVKILLNGGADVGGEAAPFGDALHAAAAGGHEGVVRLLLHKGADINSRLGARGSVLQVAAESGKLGVVKLLVAEGASGCSELGCVVTAAAAEGTSFEVLKFLLHCSAGTNCKHDAVLHRLIDRAVITTGDHEQIQALLNRGADVNSWGGEEYGRPLHVACRRNHLEIVKLLLQRGADVHALDGKGGSVLQAACLDQGGCREERFGNSRLAAPSTSRDSIISMLLDHGADVNALGGVYGTALQAAAAWTTERGSSRLLKFLLDHGADVNGQGGLYGTALQAATLSIEPEAGVGLLLEHGADVNAQAGEYGTALQAAALRGGSAVGIVRLLLDCRADVNAEGGKYGTALQAACASAEADELHVSTPSTGTNKAEIARLLIGLGANVHWQGGHFGSAWHAAAAAEREYPVWKETVQLLLDQGVDINDARGWKPHGPTALHAVLGGKYLEGALDKLGFLLARGANPNISAGTFGFPLQAACAVDYALVHFPVDDARVSKFLGRCPSVDVDAQGGLFGCALQAAAHSGQTRSARLLLDRGADVNLRGGKYGSALNAAVVRGIWDIVEMLLQAGAEPDCWRLAEPDQTWLGRVREEHGRGGVERYMRFWEKHKGKREN